jgi:hypothetical protein
MKYEMIRVHDNGNGDVFKCDDTACTGEHMFSVYEREHEDGTGKATWVADFALESDARGFFDACCSVT